MANRQARILILCKTYPSPSTKYTETSCVAGLEDTGKLIRLYPVPFRLIGDEIKFKKWQWITAQVVKAKNDHRPESHNIGVDTITLGSEIRTQDGWAERRLWLDKLPVFERFSDLEQARLNDGTTLGVLRPARVIGLDISPQKNRDWTEDEKQKLLGLQNQGNLFCENDVKDFKTLRKMPYDFYYNYVCFDASGHECEEWHHKIVDWEIGANYWKLERAHGRKWEAPFREMFERRLPSKDLMFLMGTIHRFPDQWLIISLIYPPKWSANAPRQLSLL